MATLSVVVPSNAGVQVTLASVGASGDKFDNHGREMVIFQNGDASSATVTVTAAAADNFGIVSTAHDITQTVAAGDTFVFGPFDVARFNDSNGQVKVTSSNTNSAVKIGVVRGPQ